MKPLFLLGRTSRSVATLEEELVAFEKSVGLSADDSMALGDLAFWPIVDRRGTPIGSPEDFCRTYADALKSGPLREYVVGELGRKLLSASETEHIDEFDGRKYLYGQRDFDEEDELGQSEANDSEDDDGVYCGYEDYEEQRQYVDRRFQSLGASERFKSLVGREDVPSFGRKLLITVGRNPDRRFLEGRVGERLRAKLGENARVVLNAQGADVVAIAFETFFSPAEFFEQFKRLLPPRLVEDFLIMDIGLEFSIGDQPISLFAEWHAQQRRMSGCGRKSAHESSRSLLAAATAKAKGSAEGGMQHLIARSPKQRWYPPPGWSVSQK